MTMDTYFLRQDLVLLVRCLMGKPVQTTMIFLFLLHPALLMTLLCSSCSFELRLISQNLGWMH